jgi:hypothetical protein
LTDTFEKSGNIIEQINNHMIKDILNSDFTDTAKYMKLFDILQDYEVKAFNLFL